jgi:hypothetical protein
VQCKAQHDPNCRDFAPLLEGGCNTNLLQTNLGHIFMPGSPGALDPGELQRCVAAFQVFVHQA